MSILGLVLMATAAITAAIVPGKKDEGKVRFVAASLTNSTIGEYSSITCNADTNAHITNGACNASTDCSSGTTIDGEATSNAHRSSEDDDGGEGANNTTSDDVITSC